MDVGKIYPIYSLHTTAHLSLVGHKPALLVNQLYLQKFRARVHNKIDLIPTTVLMFMKEHAPNVDVRLLT